MFDRIQYTSNSRKLSRQKFLDYLACEFTAHYLCRSAKMKLCLAPTTNGFNYLEMRMTLGSKSLG